VALAEEDEKAVDEALRAWRQGDVCMDAGLEFLHFADLSRPHSPTSLQVADALKEAGAVLESGSTAVLGGVRGVVMLIQTCDVFRGCRDRPFVEVSPLIRMGEQDLEDIRRLKRPAFVYVSVTAADCLVADLDRTMTVEKAVVAGWTRTPGWETDDESRDFALALARKRSRFAFPDDFVSAAGLSRGTSLTSTAGIRRKALICGRCARSGSAPRRPGMTIRFGSVGGSSRTRTRWA